MELVAVAVAAESDVADNTVVCGLTISAIASPTIRITSNHGNFFSALLMTALSFAHERAGMYARLRRPTIALFRGITVNSCRISRCSRSKSMNFAVDADFPHQNRGGGEPPGIGFDRLP